MPTLRFSRDAQADLKKISRFIARDKPVAARKWVESVKAKCRLVASQSGLGEIREDLGEGVHATIVGTYVVFYRVTGRNLEISRIIRGDRDIRSV